MLSQVNIAEEKVIYETRIDKIIYNAENDLNETEDDATDVLRKAPLLSVYIPYVPFSPSSRKESKAVLRTWALP